MLRFLVGGIYFLNYNRPVHDRHPVVLVVREYFKPKNKDGSPGGYYMEGPNLSYLNLLDLNLFADLIVQNAQRVYNAQIPVNSDWVYNLLHSNESLKRLIGRTYRSYKMGPNIQYALISEGLGVYANTIYNLPINQQISSSLAFIQNINIQLQAFRATNAPTQDYEDLRDPSLGDNVTGGLGL